MNQQSEATESAQGRPRSTGAPFRCPARGCDPVCQHDLRGGSECHGPFSRGARGEQDSSGADRGAGRADRLLPEAGFAAPWPIGLGHYWAITLVGFGLNMIAVPLLALAGRWEMAAALVDLRTGRQGDAHPSAQCPCSHTPPTRSAMAGVSGCTRRWTRRVRSSGP